MLNRSAKNDQITYAFSVLSTNISNLSMQSMLNDNRVIETLLPTLLNQLYGLSLVDLNLEKYNHPAIDLGDYFSGQAIQVTSDGSNEKMKKTIATLERHKLNEKFKNITFLIISNDPKPSFQRAGYTISIKNLGDVVRDICGLSPEKFDPIFEYCKKEFGNFFPNQNLKSILEPTILPSVDPSQDISNFLDACGFEKPYGFYSITVRNGLINLKNKLTTLNDDQRWFLNRVMHWSILHNPNIYDTCFAPLSYVDPNVSYEAKLSVKQTYESLAAVNLAYYEGEPTSTYEQPYFGIYYAYQEIEDFNFFSGICMFMSKYYVHGDNFDSTLLSNMIVGCNFSIIN